MFSLRQINNWARIGSPVLALSLAMVLTALLLQLLGYDPLKVMRILFWQPWSMVGGFAAILNRAAPLTMIAMGLSFGLRAGIWNLGAEGQLIIGACAATAVALTVPLSQPILALLVMAAAGAMGGAIWGLIAAGLYLRFKSNLIVISLMLVFVAQAVLNGLVFGPWRDPSGYNYPQSAVFAPQFWLPNIDGFPLFHSAILIAVAILVGGGIVAKYSRWNLGLKLAGESSQVAAYGGFSSSHQILSTLLVGGAAAGMAGMTMVAGSLGQLSGSVMQNYGFTAILVAFLGRLSAVGIALAGLLVALLTVGGESLRIEQGMSDSFVMGMAGLILLTLVAVDGLLNRRGQHDQ
ncbi:MAG: ABC transporter permease [Candidatus Pacebacteria bacterium]|nr:ABC transporter permease [Candidatus Paceibacterota bacterium]